jgi:hypothetical protein
MPRWRGSTRRSAGAYHGACDRQDSILRTTTDADVDGETPAASEADIDVGSDAARGHEDNWRNIAITLTNPQNLQSLGGLCRHYWPIVMPAPRLTLSESAC